MLRFLIIAVVLLTGTSYSNAQKLGDSTAVVESILGRPQIARSTSKGDLWVYATGAHITFKDGLVVAVEGVDVEAGAPAPSETMTVVPERIPARPQASNSDMDVEPTLELPPWAWIILGLLAIVSTVCNIIVLVRAFRESLLWGLGSIFVPFVSLIFIVMHWADVKRPVLINVAAACGIAATVFAAGLAEVL